MKNPNQISNYIEEITKELVKTNRRFNRNKIISYHEAGHAFTNIYHGISPLLATLLPDNNGGFVRPGYTSFKYKGTDGQLETVKNNHNILKYLLLTDTHLEVNPFCFYIVTQLSGTLADLLYTGVYNKPGFSSDCWNLFQTYHEYHFIEYAEKVIQTYVEHTISILQKNWSSIEIIAEDLYKSKTLNQRYFEMAIKSLEIERVPPVRLNLKIDPDTDVM